MSGYAFQNRWLTDESVKVQCTVVASCDAVRIERRMRRRAVRTASGGTMDEHDDDLNSSVRDQAENETADYPTTGDDMQGRVGDDEFEDTEDEDEAEDDMNLDEDETEL